MSEETKACPYCAEKIKVEAIKCKHCGSDLTSKPKKRRPWLGFVGMILVVVGIFTIFIELQIGIAVLIIGAAVLIYALASGNTKYLG